MKTNTRLLISGFILSVYLISCYPEKEVLGKWSDGKPKVVRYHKRNNKNNERFVEYYDNGKKKYIRYWRNDLMQIYKMESWYKNGAKRQIGWMKEKDSGRKYNNSDSEFVFAGLQKEYARGWYQNGKLKFETLITKDHFLLVNHFDSVGVRTRQDFIKELRPDGFDTISFKTEIEPSGRTYTEVIRWNGIPGYLSDE